MTEPPAIAPGRILVVDDNEMNRDMLSRRLVRRGYVAEIAEDGKQALQMMEHGNFDVILLDIMMPGMNGYEVLEQIKGHKEWQHIPVVMISAVDEIDSVVRCIKLGAADYLPKPFNVTLLTARVEACLARKRLRDREQIYLASLTRELEIGRQIQQGFLPADLPQAKGWELAARFLPARQVAGDFYDAFRFGNDGRIGLVVADVCDKGVGAALFMALFRSLIRAFSEQRNGTGDDASADLLRVVRSVNDYIASTHDRANMFATVFFGALDPATGHLTYVNAGHDAPVLICRDGGISRLEPTSPAVGLLPDLPFATADVTIEPGSVLTMFTDGVTDARGTGGESFGEDRLIRVLSDNESDAAGLLDRLVSSVSAFVGGATPFDDITLLAVRRSS